MRWLSALVFATAVSLLPATSALAAVTPGSAGGTQVYLTSDDAGDTLALRCEGGQVKYMSTSLLACADTESIMITGNGGIDHIDLSAITAADFPKLQSTRIDAGLGVDIVKGSQVSDLILETYEDDIINANGGDDIIEGGGQVLAGPGDDLIIQPRGAADGGAGDDRIESPSSEGPFSGGPGTDVVEFAFPASLSAPLGFTPDDNGLGVENPPGVPAGTIAWSSIERVELFLLNGPQTVDGSRFSGVLVVDGRGGNDTLIGGPNEDFLTGGPGDDTITGGPGFDWVNGGFGADRLLLKDSEIDRGVCGDDADVAIADTIDSLLGCESIDFGLSPDPPNTIGLKGSKKVTKGKIASFKFSSTKSGSTFRCKVDRGKVKPCKSPFKVKTKALKPGKHTVAVYAVDGDGNADPTPAKRQFTVQAASKPRKGSKPAK